VKIESGSVLAIPLAKGLGYVYCKYVDLMRIDSECTFPDVIKVFVDHSDEVLELEQLSLRDYLVAPMLVAGVRPTIRKKLWRVIGKLPLHDDDCNAPDFKDGGSTYEEIQRNEWFLVEGCKLRSRRRVPYDSVKYLQPFTGFGTGSIEIQLTMHWLLFGGMKVEDFFDLRDEKFKWCYTQIQYSPGLHFVQE
jgi:hypothetical protein